MSRGGAGLLDEALPPLGVGHPVRGQDLQGDEAAEAGVAGVVDLAHPSRAEGREDLVPSRRVPAATVMATALLDTG